MKRNGFFAFIQALEPCITQGLVSLIHAHSNDIGDNDRFGEVRRSDPRIGEDLGENTLHERSRYRAAEDRADLWLIDKDKANILRIIGRGEANE